MYIYILIGLVFIMLLTIFYSIAVKDAVNPMVIFNLPLFFSYLCYFILYKDSMPVSDTTLTAFFLGIVFFSIGFFLFSWIPIKEKSFSDSVNFLNGTQRNYIIKGAIILGLISFVYDIIYFKNLGMQSFSIGGSFTSNLRENYVRAENVPFLVTYGKYFLLFPFLIILLNQLNKGKPIKKIYLYALLILTVSSAFFTLSRTDLMISVIPIVIIFLESGNRAKASKFGKYMIGLLLGLVLMVLITKIRTSSAGISNGNGFFTAANPVMQYFGKPLPTFDQWISMNAKSGTRISAFEPLEKVLMALGLVSNNQTFAVIGQFNVYSFLKQPYLDGGIIAVLCWMFIIGLFVNQIYKRAISGYPIALLFYAIYSYALFMAFFAWQFTIVTYVYFAIFLLFVYPISKSNVSERNVK